LPVAPAAAATATSSTPSLTRFAFTRRAFLARLRLTEPAVFIGRSAIIVFMRNCVLGHGVMREVLCVLRVFTRLATAAAASATTPAPPTTTGFAFATFGFAILAFAAFDSLLGFGGEFGFIKMLVDLNRLVFRFRDGHQLGVLGGEAARNFRGVHLFTAVDHIRLLAGDRRVGRHRNGDAESFLQRAQVGALVIEHVERDLGPRAHNEIVRRALDQHFLDGTQQLQGDRRDGANMATAAANRAFFS
jgi:hypothetical protein